MGSGEASVVDLLPQAAAAAGIVVQSVELIREGSNVLVGLGDDVVARIGPEGTATAARRQLAVARWLQAAGLSVVTPVADVPQPVVVSRRPVTWWRRIPAHRHSTSGELGAVLRRLHALPAPRDPELTAIDPFAGLGSVVDAVDDTVLDGHERAWLRDRVATLQAEYAALRPGLRDGVVHGDAWQGNVVVPLEGGGPVLVDLDSVSIGPREWDLVPLAVDHVDFARISPLEYRDFVDAVGGTDVRTSPVFAVLGAVTEIRWTAFTIRKARTDRRLVEEVRHRIRCLRGAVPKPWTWTAS